MGTLALLNSFIGTKFKIEYDGKTLAGEGSREAEKMSGGAEGLKTKISRNQQVFFGMIHAFCIPMIQKLGLVEVVKATDLDKISISLSVPKYQNGFAFSFKTPGLSKLLDELLDKYDK